MKHEFKRGMLGYASIIAALKTKAMPAMELSALFGLNWNTPRVVLRQLHHLNLVHISGWVKASLKGPVAAVWAAGPGVDVQAPPSKTGSRSSNRSLEAPRLGVEVITFARVMETLLEPTSAQSLSAETGICEHTAYRFLRHMRELRMVYTADWDCTVAAMPVPMFRLGYRRNKDRPVPLARAEIWRRSAANREARRSMQDLIHRTAAPRHEALAA